MAKGWMGKFLEVDLTTRTVRARGTMPYAREYIGGRGITARLAWETIPPGIDAFDPKNRLILFTGPLTGTTAPTSGRTVFMSVSPRVYPRPWITHSTMGGWFGSELKYAGFGGLVISGRADAPVYLSIEDGRAEIKDASDLWGLGTRDVQIRLKQRHGEKARVICIGPAGENLVGLAAIQHAEECASGHSGFGGVLGSKKLKGVVVRGTQGVEIARPAEMFAEVERTREAAWVSPLDGFCNHSAFRKDTPKEAKRRPVCSQSCTMNCLLVNLHRVEGQPDDVTACIGVDYTNEELESIGERVFNLERAMLAEFGRDRQVDASIEPHFELPCKTDGTYLDKALFDELMDSYYQYRGWDMERGWPAREKLEELGLDDVADRLGV